MLMLLVILGTLGMIALIVRWLRDDGTCPLCGNETVEVGYQGYKCRKGSSQKCECEK